MSFRDQPIVVALEIGTTKCRVLVGEAREDQHLTILGIGESESRGVRKSEVVDFNAALQSVHEALSRAESSADVGIKEVNLLISGANIRTIVNRGSISIMGGDEITSEDVEHVRDVARNVALPADSEIIRSMTQQFEVDDQKRIINPIGLEGRNLSVEMLILYASSSWLRNFVKVAKSADVDVADYAPSGLCSALAVLSEEDKQQGAVVIDLGGGSTNYVAYAGRVFAAAGSFAVGGDHVTNDLAYGLKVTLPQAERLKEAFGSAMVDLPSRSQHVELTSESSGRGRYVRLGDLQTITHLRMEETLNLIRDDLERRELLPYLARGVILTGGGASLKRIADLAEQVFNLPSQVGRPKNVSGVAIATGGAQYASTIGLLRYALMREMSQGRAKGLSRFNPFRRNR